MKFLEQEKLMSDYAFSGRFGTTLGKIGDINLDGYNDIAIAAPFEGNGAVYIHLGGPYGLSPKASQRIQAPQPLPTRRFKSPSTMFGYGISKGVDIDANGYRDIAIGAPDSEVVYIFKSYPVYKVLASLKSSQIDLSLNDSKVEIAVCAKAATAVEKGSKVGKDQADSFLHSKLSFI